MRIMRCWVWAILCLAVVTMGAVEAGAAETKEVHFLVYRGCEEACQGFQDYFKRQNLPARIVVKDAAQDKKRAMEIIAETKAAKPDLVVTWGTTMTELAIGTMDSIDPAKHITETPVIFMIVSNPVASKIVPNLTSSGRQVTGTLYLLPEETQLKAARLYMDFKKVGFLLNTTESNSATTLKSLQALGPKMGFTLVERQIPLKADGKPDAGALPRLVAELAAEGVDLIYYPPDTFLNTQRDVSTTAALENHLPVFAAAENPVARSKALFGVVNRYGDVGRFTAYQASRILFQNVKPSDIPIELPRRFSYLINLPTAKELGIFPPLSLLDVAEIVGQESATPPAAAAVPAVKAQ